MRPLFAMLLLWPVSILLIFFVTYLLHKFNVTPPYGFWLVAILVFSFNFIIFQNLIAKTFFSNIFVRLFTSVLFAIFSYLVVVNLTNIAAILIYGA